jgi:peptidyl-prolyl cis-trans isomerase B (cyclophilin B)
MKNKIYKLILLSAVVLLFAGCSFGTVKKKEKDMSNIHHIKIEIEKFGDVEAELDGNEAPITVANFIKLANSGFYDGLTFHRNIEGFMAQGGDPTGTGRGGSDSTIEGEFKSNGHQNKISHVRGTLSMARANGDPNSASSQFFIVQKDAPHLDGEYAAFGHVTSGMETIDKLLAETPVEDENGTTLKENQPIIKKITVID